MKIYTKEQALENKKELVQKLKAGEVFVYPTDTIYGIGCDATNSDSVKRLKQIKKRVDKPMSVIAPSKDWIKDNFIIDKTINVWLEKLPGPYTFILKSKNHPKIKQIQDNVAMGGLFIGVRMIDHWFQEFVKTAGVSIVTTSANITGEPFAKDIKKLSLEIKNNVNFIIDDGVLNSSPSTIVDFSTQKPRIIKR